MKAATPVYGIGRVREKVEEPILEVESSADETKEANA